jgi:cell division protein FtsW
MTIRWLRVAFWLLTILLCGFGMVMVASTTAGMGRADGESLNYGFLAKQALALVVGLIVAGGVSLIGSERLRKGWLVGLVTFGSLAALVAVHVVGREINGARRWIDLGPINIQPAEFAKLALVLAAAWHLTRVAEKVRVFWHGIFIPLVAFAVVAGLIYLTKDLGSVVVLAVVLGAMFFFGGARWDYYVGLGAGCLPALLYVAVYQVAYRRDRMLAFLDPWNSEGPAAYHLRQSYIAIGSGGLFGVGLGQSSAKMAFLPEKHTDFIFAVICEELGFVGAVSVAGIFLLLIITGFAIAHQAKDRHQRLLAIGATMVLGVQAFWNMLVVVGAVPTKGLTLPFISYGGSSLVVSLVLVGIVDAVARSAARSKRRTSAGRIGAQVVGSSSWKWETQPGS